MHLITAPLLVAFLLYPFQVSAGTIGRRADVVHEIYRFPTNHKAENLAVRGNGQILVTINDPAPYIYQFDPCSIREPVIVTTLPSVTAALGITELEPDLFYVAAGNLSFPLFTTQPQSFFVFEVDMRPFRATANGTITHNAVVRKVAAVPNAGLLNGMSSVYSAYEPPKDFVLVADTFIGMVWNVNVRTGAVVVAADDETMKPVPGAVRPIGVNGVKVRGDYLYYTNTGKSSLYRIPIDTQTGIVLNGSKAELLVQNLPDDDFVLDARGFAYVAGSANVINLADTTKGTTMIVAGTFNSTSSALVGPTAVEFGRLASDKNSIYVTTNGGVQNTVIGAQGLSRIDVNDEAQRVIL